MNLIIPLAFELYNFASAYIPNLCSDKGGICLDKDVDVIILNLFDNVESYFMYPFNSFLNGLTSYFYAVFSNTEGGVYEKSTIMDNVFEFLHNSVSADKLDFATRENYMTIFHILLSYLIYICVAKGTIKQRRYGKIKFNNVFTCGDYYEHASDCSSFIYQRCGNGEHCCCKLEYQYDNDSDYNDETIDDN